MVLWPLLVLNLTAGDPNWEVIAPVPQIQAKTLEPISFKQACTTRLAATSNWDVCKQYKRREIAGFVLLPVGIGMAVGGGYMVYRGVLDIQNNVNNNINNDGQGGAYVSKHDIVLVSVGSAMSIIGLVLAPTGLSMGVSGAVRYRRHCGNNAHTFYIGPDKQATGLACTF